MYALLCTELHEPRETRSEVDGTMVTSALLADYLSMYVLNLLSPAKEF